MKMNELEATLATRNDKHFLEQALEVTKSNDPKTKVCCNLAIPVSWSTPGKCSIREIIRLKRPRSIPKKGIAKRWQTLWYILALEHVNLDCFMKIHTVD